MPWLTNSVFKQQSGEPLIRMPRFSDDGRRLRFRHVVHAYDDRELPANTDAQALTFRTIEEAKAYAGPELPVRAVAVSYPDDAHMVPDSVTLAPPLVRNVTDVTEFTTRRSLPLLFDILEKGLAEKWNGAPADGADYVVLTNSDIHLQPYFYRVLAELLGQGWDAITVNRRTVDADPEHRTFSALFLADAGSDHPGFDCFVFPALWFDDFAPSHSCCGAGYVMRSLLFNIVARSSRMLMLTNAHMTFHLGDDRKWEAPSYDEYVAFNLAEAQKVLESFAEDAAACTRLHDFVMAHEDDPFKETIRRLAGVTRS